MHRVPYPRSILLLVCMLVLCSVRLQAQGFSEYNWLFGNHQRHITFLKGSEEIAILDTINLNLGLTGAAVATEGRSGELLFFSDGRAIYDVSYQVMDNGGALSGDVVANPGALIIPATGQPNVYFVLYKNTAGDILYSTVNMNQQGNGLPKLPFGAVVERDQLLISGPVGAFTTIQGDDDGPHFIAYQELSSNDLVVVPINPANLPPIGVPVAETLPGPTFLANSISFNRARRALVVAPATANTNVHLFTMDLALGTLVFDSAVVNTGFSDGVGANVYDAELSRSGRMLYVSRGGDDVSSGNVFQVDLDSGTSVQSALPVTVARSYGLKLGPDGNIYHLFQSSSGGPYLMGRITQADSTLDLVGYDTVDIGIADWRAEQFPEISGEHEDAFAISFTTADTCTGGTTKFFADVDPTATSYMWEFDTTGDLVSTAISPVVEFPNAGVFRVRLTVDIPGMGSQTTTRDVTIVENEGSVTLGADTTICPGETLVLMAEGNEIVPGSHGWSVLDSTTNLPFKTESISVREAGDYWVRVDFTNGCVGVATVNVSIFDEQERTSNFWEFGENVKIDFNEDPPIVSSNNIMDAPEGVAVLSDGNGHELLYTDGNQVYTRNDQVMAPGLPIGGNLNATQSSIIVPFGSATDADVMYYVFTTDEIDSCTFELAYSVVDLRGDGALGEVLVQATDRVIFTNATERLTLVDFNGTPTVVTHEYGTNSFVGFPVTADGVQGPIYLSGGSVHSRANPDEGEGYLKFNAAADKMAVALKTSAANTVEVFDVDQEAGSLNNLLQIVLPDPPSLHTVYGLEFSTGGSKLFISSLGTPNSVIYEVRVDSNDQDFAQSSLRRVNQLPDGANQRFGAIQTAPTGQILVAVDGATALGVIQPAEDTLRSAFALNAFSLATSDGSTVRSRLGLPNFAQSSLPPENEPIMSTEDGCLGNVLSFSGAAISQLDTLTWFFGDGNTAIGDTVSHQYAEAGTYFVTLQLTNRCGLDTVLTDSVHVFNEIPEPTIPNSISLCEDPIVLDAADGIAEPDWMYFWSTGESTQTISISDFTGTAMLVSVVITDSVGCTSTDSTLVVDGRPVFDLGPDLTVCQGDEVPDLNANNNGATFVWTLNGANTGNTSRLQTVNTSAADTLVYTLTVNDTITGCSDADTVTIIVNPRPVFTTNTTETTGCGLFNGSAEAVITSPVAFTVAWSGPGGFTSSLANTGNVLAAGAYSVTVTDAVNGCATTEGVSVSDGGDDFDIVDVIPGDSCVNSTVQVVVNDSIPNGSNVDYLVQSLNTGISFSGSERIINSRFTIDGLSPGDFFIQVINSSGCVKDSTFTINQLAQAPITTPSFLDACGGSTQVSVDVSGVANPQILWTAFNGGSFPISEDITQATVTVDAAGLYLVTVNDTGAGLCPTTDSVTVNLNPFPGVSINTEGANCEGQKTLNITTAPEGNYSTVWTRDGAQVGIGPSLVVTESGRYDVRATLQTTGCEATDFAAVVVSNPLEIQATGTAACDDGNPITITAFATGGDSLLYTWRGPGQISGTYNVPTLDVMEPGTYEVIVRRNLTPSDGCSATDQIVIERIPFDTLRATPEAVVCPPDPDPSINSTELIATGNFIAFNWTLPNNSKVSGATLITSAGGMYQVVAQDAFGCRDTAVSQVREFCEVFVRGPTAFRPGSRVGPNGSYSVVYRNIEEGSFNAFIYNRWGDLIRQFNTPDFEWDGTAANGQPAPPGTYAVVFRYRNQFSEKMEVFEEHSRVTLIR